MNGIVINIDPVILHSGNFELRWYGVMIMLAAVAGIFVLLQRGTSKGISRDDIYSLIPWVFVGGLAGARLFHVIDNFAYYWKDPLLVFQFQQGGLAIWGALAGGAIAAIIYCRVRKLSIIRLADAAVPALLVAQIVGRVGCIINGDSYGSLTSLPWGFIYTNPGAIIPPSYWGVPTHPYPVYEMLWNGISLLVLLKLEHVFKKDSLMFFSYLALYAVGRFILTFVRQENIWFWGLQEAQVLALAIFFIAATAAIYIYRKPFNQVLSSR
jgi:phosphatidylglycerol---prolipoprotein diacylglyceryl transferase